MKNELLILLVGLLVGITLVYVYLAQPTLEFKQVGSACASEEEPSVSISGEQGKISFSGNVITPNPCYELNAKLKRAAGTLTIVITAKPEKGPCVDCIGSVEYSGEIKDLKPGTYTVEMIYDGEQVALEEVTVE